MSPLLSRFVGRPSVAILVLWLSGLGAGLARAQEPPKTAPSPAPETQQAPAAPAAVEPQPPAPAPAPAGPSGDTGEEQRPKPHEQPFLPRLDVFFPEGDLDLRVNHLVNKVFFEGQVKYNFIKGDISAFLRYRYYGYRRITQFSVFDTIEFQDVHKFSNDFDRVRGTLLLMQWPHSFQQRTYGLAELDRISSNRQDIAQVLLLGHTNTFLRFGYQVGTPEDVRSNAIVGETRAATQRLFTAYREIGPGGAGFTGAVTYGFPYGLGDFNYVKVESEALKRFDISERTFLIARVHAGSFLHKDQRNLAELPTNYDKLDTYTIPRGEFFSLGGRDNLRGLSSSTEPGTEELHSTFEYFFPWFLDENRDFVHLQWQNWYWILYTGAGTVGFDRKVYTDLGKYIPDVGLGFETSFKLRKYGFFLSGIVAHALKGNGGVEARVSVKSYH
jgi:hypothetical protein